MVTRRNLTLDKANPIDNDPDANLMVQFDDKELAHILGSQGRLCLI